MALPTQDNNLVGTHILPVADLGLSASLPNATPVTGTPFSTGVPGTVVVLGQLSSGTCTVDVRVDDTSADAIANIGSPTATISLSSTTKMYTSVDTNANASANTSNLFVCIQQTGAAGGSIFTQLAVLALYKLVGGEDWYSIRHGGLNAVAGTTGVGNVSDVTPSGFQDGTGVISLAIA